MSYLDYNVEPLSSIATFDKALDGARKVFDEMCKSTCYKVTFTFNRKYWKRSRAFKHVYEALRIILEQADVEEGLFFMETHNDGFPHVHGFIRWTPFNTSVEFLRKKMVDRFGQTKIFKYDPEGYTKSKEEESKYSDWYEYISKDFKVMESFRTEHREKFDISSHFLRIRDEDDASEDAFEKFM